MQYTQLFNFSNNKFTVCLDPARIESDDLDLRHEHKSQHICKAHSLNIYECVI